jgi:hypothetical protein
MGTSVSPWYQVEALSVAVAAGAGDRVRDFTAIEIALSAPVTVTLQAGAAQHSTGN